MKLHLTFLLFAVGLALSNCEAQSTWPLPIRAYFLPSGSMEPTLLIGDRIMVEAHAYDEHDPRNGEIAIFKAPDAAFLDSGVNLGDVDFVKRVVGVPKQRVEMVKGRLRVDGAWVSEPHVQWKNPFYGAQAKRASYDLKIVGGVVYSRDFVETDDPGEWLWMKNGVLIADMKEQQRISAAKTEPIPARKYLVLGDHRFNSNDSHVFGLVSREAFRGRALFVYWPLNRWKTLLPAK